MRINCHKQPGWFEGVNVSRRGPLCLGCQSIELDRGNRPILGCFGKSGLKLLISVVEGWKFQRLKWTWRGSIIIMQLGLYQQPKPPWMGANFTQFLEKYSIVSLNLRDYCYSYYPNSIIIFDPHCVSFHIWNFEPPVTFLGAFTPEFPKQPKIGQFPLSNSILWLPKQRGLCGTR